MVSLPFAKDPDKGPGGLTGETGYSVWKAADDGTISLVGEPQAHRQLKDAKAYVESLIDPSPYVQADLWAGLELSSPALHSGS